MKQVTLVTAISLCTSHNSINFKVNINTNFIVYQTFQQLHILTSSYIFCPAATYFDQQLHILTSSYIFWPAATYFVQQLRILNSSYIFWPAATYFDPTWGICSCLTIQYIIKVVFRLILNYIECMRQLCSTQCHHLYDPIHEPILSGFLLLHTHFWHAGWSPFCLTKRLWPQCQPSATDTVL